MHYNTTVFGVLLSKFRSAHDDTKDHEWHIAVVSEVNCVCSIKFPIKYIYPG